MSIKAALAAAVWTLGATTAATRAADTQLAILALAMPTMYHAEYRR